MLDPYHDRRTGYEFQVNPAGVKTDYAISNDGDEDVAWDAVWDAATRDRLAGLDRRIPDSAVAAALLARRAAARSACSSGASSSAIPRPLPGRSIAPLEVRPGLAVRHPDRPRRAGQRRPRGGHALRRHQERARRRRPRTSGERQDVTRRRRPPVPARLQPAAQRDGQSGFRPGGGRSVRAQPQRLRDLLQRAAAVLRGREGAVHVHA